MTYPAMNIPSPTSQPPTLLTLPLEIRLLIYHYALPPSIEADCCEQATSTSNPTRRLPSNPWYPSPQLPTFTYPTPHLPLRLLCHQTNTEILHNIPPPPLTARACDFLCLRRALSILSSQPLYPPTALVAHPRHPIAGHPINLTHVSRVRVTSERVHMSSRMSQQGRAPHSEAWAKLNRQARVSGLAKSMEGELGRYWREVRFVGTRWSLGLEEEMRARMRGEGLVAVQVELVFEVGRLLRGGLVVGDGGKVAMLGRRREVVVENGPWS